MEDNTKLNEVINAQGDEVAGNPSWLGCPGRLVGGAGVLGQIWFLQEGTNAVLLQCSGNELTDPTQ